MRKTVISLLTIFAFLGFAVVAGAGEITVKAGDKTVCKDASWIVYNLSETDETTMHAAIGPVGYNWAKKITRVLSPGGYQANAITRISTITNKGPGTILVNCQRQTHDRHDWKIDAGSGKTYQSDYHMDHVKPGTYIEPGMGMEVGHERGLFSQRGAATGGATREDQR